MVADLTGLPLANASLLDEATAAAEAMTLCRAAAKPERTGFFVAEDCHPQTIAVVRTRAAPLGIEVHVGPVEAIDFAAQKLFGVLVQYPATDGVVRDYAALAERAHAGRRAARRRDGPARARRCCGRRASSAPTSPSAPPSASACRWASAARTPRSSRRRTRTSATCPAGSSASRRTPRAARPTAWRCRRASSTSGATRPRATSARRRCCSRSWPRCTPSTTARRACQAIARRVHAAGALPAARPAAARLRRGPRALLRHAARAHERRAGPRDPGARPGEGHQPALATTTARSASRSTRRRCRRTWPTCSRPSPAAPSPFTPEQLAAEAEAVLRRRARADAAPS